jgi:hypothetical protein
MSNFSKPTTFSHLVQRLWKPAIATGTGGTALVIWFEEILSLATEFIGVIFLPILAGIIYLFNILLFKSRELKGDDLKKVKERLNQ